MCGLTGLFRSASSDDIVRQVAKMTARLVHRGPDYARVWAEVIVGLGHGRFLKLVLTLTHAPMLVFQSSASECA